MTYHTVKECVRWILSVCVMISYIISDVMMMWMKVVEKILSFCFRIGVAVGAHGLEECVGWILKFWVMTYHTISYVMLTWMMWWDDDVVPRWRSHGPNFLGVSLSRNVRQFIPSPIWF